MISFLVAKKRRPPNCVFSTISKCQFCSRSSTRVTVIVKDVNIFPPEFYPPLTGRILNISESTQPGTYLQELKVKKFGHSFRRSIYPLLYSMFANSNNSGKLKHLQHCLSFYC